ncbi:elongation factor P 5-aminopentanone reductase [Salisediminibacterium beveridgei]|uniref:elongation factor P 5-aminopentanone reductase n=1 Tax=Salisediminibacterium beveridgei TaxID=632773 RepID=UPI0018DD58B6|nr:SDR family oxidoreductase [Salisediminibacterium beveridgei]
MKRKRVWITGASGDIGYAIAEEAAKTGSDLVLHCFRNEQPLRRLSSNYPELDIRIVQCDFTDSLRTLECFHSMPCPDVFVHCAGYSDPKLFQEEEHDSIRAQMQSDLITPMLLIRSFIPDMISRRAGNILFITSIWGQTGASMEVLYSTVKSGQHGLVRSLADELGPSGIRVNGIAPGIIHTRMVSNYSKQDIDAIKREIPAGRLGHPEDIAHTTMFLTGEGADYINGQIIGVNGGWHRG